MLATYDMITLPTFATRQMLKEVLSEISRCSCKVSIKSVYDAILLQHLQKVIQPQVVNTSENYACKSILFNALITHNRLVFHSHCCQLVPTNIASFFPINVYVNCNISPCALHKVKVKIREILVVFNIYLIELIQTNIQPFASYR